MGIDMPENINSIDCIRCKRCVDACPQRSLSLSWLKPQTTNTKKFQRNAEALDLTNLDKIVK